MYKQNTFHGKKSFVAMVMALLSSVAVAAYAAKDLVQDRRINVAQAQNMLKKAQATQGSNDFPLVINERVLFELNRFLGTPDGREQVRKALARMPLYQDMIFRKINAAHAPAELVGVAFAESGFSNLPQPRNHRSAGLWQFIPETARRFGMKVNRDIDERLHPEKATDAALEYLLTNKALFEGNWHLSIMAYNAGEKRILEGIKALNTKDPWELAKNGYEGDSNYLARVIASILILKNPDSAN